MNQEYEDNQIITQKNHHKFYMLHLTRTFCRCIEDRGHCKSTIQQTMHSGEMGRLIYFTTFVNFPVHNKHHFDNNSNKYFLLKLLQYLFCS